MQFYMKRFPFAFIFSVACCLCACNNKLQVLFEKFSSFHFVIEFNNNFTYNDSLRQRNILYINLCTDKDGIPHFKDMAAVWGLDVNVQSTMASFFDYDNDGDLDMYLTVNEASNGYSSSVFRQRNSNTVHSTG